MPPVATEFELPPVALDELFDAEFDELFAAEFAEDVLADVAPGFEGVGGVTLGWHCHVRPSAV